MTASQRHYIRHVVPLLAQGLTAAGKTPKRFNLRSARIQRLVAEYRRRLAAQKSPPRLSSFESAWHAERATMGDLTIPDASSSSLRYETSRNP